MKLLYKHFHPRWSKEMGLDCIYLFASNKVADMGAEMVHQIQRATWGGSFMEVYHVIDMIYEADEADETDGTAIPTGRQETRHIRNKLVRERTPQ